MSYGKAVAGGLVGGLIGAGIWAGITYGTHREIGWIAWGVGGLVGLGVRLAAQEKQGAAYGVLAVGIAVASIVLGKFLAVSLIASDFKVEANAATISDQIMIRNLADEVVKDRQAKGKKVTFPAGKTLDTASEPADYPPDVWQEATKKWKALPPAEQQKRKADRAKEMEQLMGEIQGAIRNEGFKESFSPFDILWFLLAALTAYRLGHGGISTD